MESPHFFPPPFKNFMDLFFWLCWVFIAACGISLGVAAPRCCAQASLVSGHGLGSGGPRAQRVESSRTRERPCVSCLSRWTLSHWPAWEVPLPLSSRVQPIPPGSPALHGEASKLWSQSSQTTSCLFSFFLFLTPVFFLKWTYSKKDLKNFFFLAAP